MKTKFTSGIGEIDLPNEKYPNIDHSSFETSYGYLQFCYEELHKEHGWQVDFKSGDIFMIFHEPLYFNIGDIVIVRGERSIHSMVIFHKIINLTEGYIEYQLEDEEY
jgi:hypothetical protein